MPETKFKPLALIARMFNWVFQKIKRFWQWLSMRKADVVTEADLWFFHTKRIIVVFLIFISLSLLSAIAFISNWKSGEEVTAVPDLIGMSLERSLLELEKQNLYGVIKQVSDISQPDRQILDQDPKPGFFTKEKRAVILFINQQPEAGEVPNLIGKTVDEARLILTSHASTNYQAIINRVGHGHSELVGAGLIAAQTPAPTSPASNPLLVDVIISLGRSHSSLVLPDLTQNGIDGAVNWLAFNNLSAVFVNDEARPAGDRIYRQEPAAGTRINEGGSVRLSIGGKQKIGVIDFVFPLMLKLSQSTIDFGNQAKLNQENENLTVEELKLKQQQDEERLQRELIREGDERYQVRLVLRDPAGDTRTIFAGEKKPGDHLIQSFSYQDRVTLEFLIGDRKFITREYR